MYFDKAQAEGCPDPKAAAYSKISVDDIAQTHNVIVESTYVPIIEFATETITVPSATGSVGANGGTLTYSLPVYGDFIHDLAFFTLWSSISCDMGTLPALPDDVCLVLGASLPTNATSPIFNSPVPPFVEGASTAYSVHYYYLDTFTGEVLEPDSAVTDPDTPFVKTHRMFNTANKYQDYCRWVNYPGEAQCEKVSFSINGNPIDQYNKYTHVFH